MVLMSWNHNMDDVKRDFQQSILPTCKKSLIDLSLIPPDALVAFELIYRVSP